jgi:hypothetical protein
MGQLSKLKQTAVKISKNIIHSKLVMNIMIVICLLNLIGYIMMRRYNAIMFGLLAGGVITQFSKNKTVIMMATLFIVNFFITGSIVKEGMDGSKGKIKLKQKKRAISKETNIEKEDELNSEDNDDVDDEEIDQEDDDFIETSEIDAFDTRKNNTALSKKSDKTIDYAATVETAYDDLNNILGGEGIKNLTNDTQNLVSQQKQLAEAMQGMEPLIKNFGPLMNQATSMMKTMGNSGLANLVKGN